MDHVTNDPLNLLPSIFEVKDSNVTLNINQLMSPSFGEDILELLEDQDQRARTRGLGPDDHVTNSPAHSALSMLFWYTLDSILQLFGSDTMFDESMNASDVNCFTYLRSKQYENNCSIQLSLSMIICFYLIFWKVMLF